MEKKRNLYVTPTDKPSRLFLWSNIEKIIFSLTFDSSFKEGYKKMHGYVNQHIYITNDEEIKEGNYHISSDGWCIDKTSKEDLEVVNEKRNGYKKIILTDNKDLIKDGVQAIPDDFLEWFVKNLSCEWVEINFSLVSGSFKYIIIIPKEEPEQKWDINTCRYWGMEIGCERETCICENTEPKQELERGITITHIVKPETLEEAYRIFLQKKHNNPYLTNNELHLPSFEFGTKWNQERSYTLEQISKEFIGEGTNGGYFDDYLDFRIETNNKITFKEWFEQFKKK